MADLASNTDQGAEEQAPNEVSAASGQDLCIDTYLNAGKWY